jgi:hypothetical protein
VGTTSVDTLGARCTVIEGNLGVELATIDLAGGHAAVMTGLIAALTMRGRGLNPPRSVFEVGPARLEAEHVGVGLRWAPAGGLRFSVEAPNLVAVVGETSVPLALPTGDALDDAGLAAAETLIGLLAPLAPSWLESVVGLLGWGARVGTRRLSLVSLLGSGADPAAAIAGWLAPALGQVGPDAPSPSPTCSPATVHWPVWSRGRARRSTRSRSRCRATARARPSPSGSLPPGPPPCSPRRDELVRWRPGAPGLATDAPCRRSRRRHWSRPTSPTSSGTEPERRADGLVARWSGGDGRIVPPLNPPAGVDVVTLEDLRGPGRRRADLADLLDHAPPVTFHVRIAARPTACSPTPAERAVDLTPANRAPETSPPARTAATGSSCSGPEPRRLATGDPDGTLGQAVAWPGSSTPRAASARASCWWGRRAGQAARLVAATAAAVPTSSPSAPCTARCRSPCSTRPPRATPGGCSRTCSSPTVAPTT